MIRSILFVAAAAVIIAATVWVADRPGEVTLVWRDWRIDTEMPVLAAAMLVLAAVVAALYRLWRGIRATPTLFTEQRRRARREKGYRALTQGMVAVAAGDADEAGRQSGRANTLLEDPPLTMLLSAQAAQLNGDEAAAQRYFKAMLENSETAFLGLRGLLMQARRDGDFEEALALASRARQLRPKTPWVLTTLFDLQAQKGQWPSALKTLEQGVKFKAFTGDDATRLRMVVLLGCSIEAGEAGDRANALTHARKALKVAPASQPAAIRVAALLAEEGNARSLSRLVLDVWARAPHPELARLYAGDSQDKDPLDIVKKFEKLKAANPDHPESHIALAQALLDAGLWGAARSHLGDAGGDEPSARICRLMAELEEGEHGDMGEVRRWLVRASTAAPDPAWICTSCGAAGSEWSPHCERCDAVGTQEWGTPERITAIAVRDGIAGFEPSSDAPTLPLKDWRQSPMALAAETAPGLVAEDEDAKLLADPEKAGEESPDENGKSDKAPPKPLTFGVLRE
jgi:HemY protein